MRFVHTADWQIGMAAAHVGEAGNRVRMARLDAIQRVADVCDRQRAEFLLIAGDTFEHNGVGPDLVAEVARRMQQMPCPVYVIPGNHDPLHHGSVWGHPVWDRSDRVHVLAERTPVPVPGGTLYPCPLFSKRSAEDPTSWIDSSPATDELRIGVAHGHAGETPNGDGSYPIQLDAAKRAGLDYLALGHWHSTRVFAGTRIAYAGTHEQTGFGEHDSGNVLVVDLAGKGTAPMITSARTGILTWRQLKESVTAEGALARLSRELSEIAEPATRLLQISLTGLLFRSDVDELVRIDKECARFLYARVDRGDLKPAPADESWMADLPAGVIRQTASWLREMTGVSGPQAEIATQSLLELYAMASEVSA
jgi:DNA repair exonuclease SbcCD nuclease subunit